MECDMKEFNKITFLINLSTKFIYDKLFLRLYAFEIKDGLWYFPTLEFRKITVNLR
jgi:hypothetical protein